MVSTGKDFLIIENRAANRGKRICFIENRGTDSKIPQNAYSATKTAKISQFWLSALL